jgi:hypothetical protein
LLQESFCPELMRPYMAGTQDPEVVGGQFGQFRLLFHIIYLLKTLAQVKGIHTHPPAEVGQSPAGDQAGFETGGNFRRSLLYRKQGRKNDTLLPVPFRKLMPGFLPGLNLHYYLTHRQMRIMRCPQHQFPGIVMLMIEYETLYFRLAQLIDIHGTKLKKRHRCDPMTFMKKMIFGEDQACTS